MRRIMQAHFIRITHNELHLVSPHSKVIFTKNQFQSITTYNSSLNPTRTIQPKLKNPISAQLALQETLSKSDLH